MTPSGLSGMISWLFWKAGGVREGSWGTGILPVGKEVTELCNKAVIWLKPGVRGDAGCEKHGQCWVLGEARIGLRLGWAGPAVAILG